MGAIESILRMVKDALDKLSAGEQPPVQVSLNIDGQKMAEVVTKHQAKSGAGPAEGAPYHDSTYSTAPFDFALP